MLRSASHVGSALTCVERDCSRTLQTDREEEGCVSVFFPSLPSGAVASQGIGLASVASRLMSCLSSRVPAIGMPRGLGHLW